MVSNAMNFTIGPSLLKIGYTSATNVEVAEPPRIRGEVHRESSDEDERQPLLPPHPRESLSRISSKFPALVRIEKSARGFLNPPLLAVICAIIVGEIEPLQRAFFAKRTEGGILNAWLTRSIENMGGLFTAYACLVYLISPTSSHS